AARRFVRGLDAALAVSARRPALAVVGWVARLLLRGCRAHAAEMERGVAAAASTRAQAVDYGLRIVAQEQVGLAYAGWDRLLTRVALPAWRMGRWPSRLDAGVVSALTELSRRDRLAEGFASRLGERPACDLLEEPGLMDEAASLLAARLFHGGPAARGHHWAPVSWAEYPEEVVDRKWRTEAARLHAVLDDMAQPVPPEQPPHPEQRLEQLEQRPEQRLDQQIQQQIEQRPGAAEGADRHAAERAPAAGPTLARVIAHLAVAEGGNSEELAARIAARLAREEAEPPAAGAAAHLPAAVRPGASAPLADPYGVGGVEGIVPLFPLQAPRSDRELLADHVTAMICCAAVDTAGAKPGLDWLDGPVLLLAGRRGADLGSPVLSLVEDGDPEPLRAWLGAAGVRPEKPVRLV
ncbi:hypothetical protein ACSNOD_24685, partial [Streptomyces sp. URMC 123]